MTREEHLQWCKNRALEYVDANDLNNALTSMLSDLSKHSETRDHPAMQLSIMLKMNGHLDTPYEMQEFINGFN